MSVCRFNKECVLYPCTTNFMKSCQHYKRAKNDIKIKVKEKIITQTCLECKTQFMDDEYCPRCGEIDNIIQWTKEEAEGIDQKLLETNLNITKKVIKKFIRGLEDPSNKMYLKVNVPEITKHTTITFSCTPIHLIEELIIPTILLKDEELEKDKNVMSEQLNQICKKESRDMNEQQIEQIKWVIFKDKIWVEPFFCLCCGKKIDIKQFCWGRLCGYCDMGSCQSKENRGNGKKIIYYGKVIGYYENGHGKKDIFEKRGISLQAKAIKQNIAKGIKQKLEQICKGKSINHPKEGYINLSFKIEDWKQFLKELGVKDE